MKKLLLAALLLSLLPAGAMAKTIANPPTAEQKAAFLAECLKVAPEAPPSIPTTKFGAN